MSTPQERTATSADGSVIAYRDHGGDGAPLLLLHGIGGNLLTMDGLARMLAPGHRCVAMEVRGCGRSDAPPRIAWSDLIADVDAVVAAQGWGAVDIVGHSLGGMIGAAYAAARPGTRLVSIDGLPPGTLLRATEPERAAFDDWLEAVHRQLCAMTAPPATGDAEWAAEEVRRITRALERLGYHAPDRALVAARQLRAEGGDRYRRTPARALVDAVMAHRTRPVLEDYRRSSAPTLLIVCSHWAPPPLVAEVTTLAEERADLQCVVLPISHLAPIHDALDEVAPLIEEFLAIGR